MPPFLMQGIRFTVASTVMLCVLKAKKVAWPSREQIRNAAFIGILLLIGGLGMVTVA